MDRAEILAKAELVLTRARAAGLMIATAESCTGGLIAACLTEIAGASDVVDRGFVTYSNAAKSDLLGVPADLIETEGAVSAAVAAAMAEGARARSQAGLAVAVTGIAGPGGGTERKPVGLVYIATALAGAPARVREFRFTGTRRQIRQASLAEALALLADRLDPARSGAP